MVNLIEEFSVRELSRAADTSARALRYYDIIGQLKPANIASNGYRVYRPL